MFYMWFLTASVSQLVLSLRLSVKAVEIHSFQQYFSHIRLMEW